MPRSPSRRSPRLAGYDYGRAGWYSVTLCVRDRHLVFGDVVEGCVVLSDAGRIAHTQWVRTEAQRPRLVPDAFVVMPNHVHLLFGFLPSGRGDDRNADDDRRDMARHVPTAHPVRFQPDGTARQFGKPAAQTVSAIVGAYESAVARETNRLWGRDGPGLWQARFHDRIVRDDAERERIRQYILDNPMRWHLDPLKP